MELGSGKRLGGTPSIGISENHIWFLYGYFCAIWQEKADAEENTLR